MEFLKWKKKGKPGKITEKEEKKHFKTGPLGEQNRQKTFKIAGKIAFLGLFTKHKHKNTGNKKNIKKQKKPYQKKHLLHFGKQPLFLVNFCFLSCILSTQKCHFGFSPVPAETPILVVFGDFEWVPKKDHFPKTDSCNVNAHFF